MGSILNMTGTARVFLSLPPPSGLFMVTKPNAVQVDFCFQKCLNARNRPHFRINDLADALPGCRQPQRKTPLWSKSSHVCITPEMAEGKGKHFCSTEVLQFQPWWLVSPGARWQEALFFSPLSITIIIISSPYY